MHQWVFFAHSKLRNKLTFSGYKRTIKYDSKSRLPIFHSIEGVASYLTTIQETEKQDMALPNLSKQQQLLLKWHNRLSHINFHHLQDLA
jgi:hypothetical protein